MVILNFLCDVGTNAYVLKFAQNNAVLLSPLAIILFAMFRAYAKKSKGTWDDALVRKYGKLFGGPPVTDAMPPTAGFTPDPPDYVDPTEPPKPGT